MKNLHFAALAYFVATSNTAPHESTNVDLSKKAPEPAVILPLNLEVMNRGGFSSSYHYLLPRSPVLPDNPSDCKCNIAHCNSKAKKAGHDPKCSGAKNGDQLLQCLKHIANKVPDCAGCLIDLIDTYRPVWERGHGSLPPEEKDNINDFSNLLKKLCDKYAGPTGKKHTQSATISCPPLAGGGGTSVITSYITQTRCDQSTDNQVGNTTPTFSPTPPTGTSTPSSSTGTSGHPITPSSTGVDCTITTTTTVTAPGTNTSRKPTTKTCITTTKTITVSRSV